MYPTSFLLGNDFIVVPEVPGVPEVPEVPEVLVFVVEALVLAAGMFVGSHGIEQKMSNTESP